ncbi:hypothetical protein X739_12250 [Mesorhizobium sp. LNHC220B00]|nr:hypothetical protein X739_12250 [Mesorhizobium sp. LNHC220B00]
MGGHCFLKAESRRQICRGHFRPIKRKPTHIRQKAKPVKGFSALAQPGARRGSGRAVQAKATGLLLSGATVIVVLEGLNQIARP